MYLCSEVKEEKRCGAWVDAVDSLNKNVQDSELNKSVFEEFKQWGRLLNVKVLRDWMGRPYGFVQFEASR